MTAKSTGHAGRKSGQLARENLGLYQPRGRYFTLLEATEFYPIFTPRLLRRLVHDRRIAFSRAGRMIVLAERDIEAYLERNRVEPPA